MPRKTVGVGDQERGRQATRARVSVSVGERREGGDKDYGEATYPEEESEVLAFRALGRENLHLPMSQTSDHGFIRRKNKLSVMEYS